MTTKKPITADTMLDDFLAPAMFEIECRQRRREQLEHLLIATRKAIDLKNALERKTHGK